MTDHQFIARTSGRHGRARFHSGLHATREDAAREVFKLDPKARDCSTSIASPDGRDVGRDIRWHKRYQLEQRDSFDMAVEDSMAAACGPGL